MSEKQLRDLIAYASQFCDRCFADKGVIYPMWHAITSRGQTLIEHSPHPNKDMAVAMMRALFDIEDVVRYVFMDEAWTVLRMLNDKEVAKADREGLEHFPGRVEVVMISGEDRDCGQLMAHREIIRPAAGKPRLGQLKMIDDLPFLPERARAQSSGRMVGMLPIRGARH